MARKLYIKKESSEYTLQTAAEEFYKHNKIKGLATATQDTYKMYVKNFNKWCGEDTRLSDITEEDLDCCVNREIARICNRTGIERFTAHCFEDTFATRYIESGMNPKTLQEILGHADISITMNLYCHVMEETKVKEMKQVDVAR